MASVPFIILFGIHSIHSQTIQTECTYSDASSTFVTFCDLNNTLRAELMEKFDFTSFHDFIGKMVRLVFHDCMGPQEFNFDSTGPISICDGCISFNNSAHGGLPDGAVNKIEKVYNNGDWKDRISRADFWAATATIAIQYSTYLSQTTDLHGSTPTPNDTIPYIPFYIGRSDCSAAPNVNISNYKQPYKDFPSGLKGWHYNFGFFRDNFGFNENEFVAILGAHTLGRVHAENSGFGVPLGTPWVQAWDILDNEFYNVLLDDLQRTRKTLKWTQLENNISGNFEWRSLDNSASGNRFVMLNADMALLFDFDSDISDVNAGMCSCNYSNCAYNEHSKSYVELYANNNQVWLNDFAAAFNKMILMGYDNENKIPNDLNILAEDWYLIENGIKPCIDIIQYEKQYENIANFEVNKDGKEYIESTEHTFLTKNTQCGSGNALNYFYNLNYVEIDSILNVDLIVCCGEGSTFENEYVSPDGYQLQGTGDAYIDTDTDTDTDIDGNQSGNKNEESESNSIIIIVVVVCVLIILLAVIGGFIFWKKRNDNLKHQVDTQINNEERELENNPSGDAFNVTSSQQHIVTTVVSD